MFTKMLIVFKIGGQVRGGGQNFKIPKVDVFFV